MSQQLLASGAATEAPATVVVLADHTRSNDTLRELLGHPPVDNFVEAEDVAGAIYAVETLHATTVLLGTSMLSGDNVDTCAKIVRGSPGTQVLFFIDRDNQMWLIQPVDGAEQCQVPDVCPAQTSVGARGDGYQAASAATSQDWPGARNGISRRESEVLQLMTQGLDNRQIARLLFISGETVKSHVKAVLRKLVARNRTHGVVIALREHMVPSAEPGSTPTGL